jgi:hypothetical protein
MKKLSLAFVLAVSFLGTAFAHDLPYGSYIKMQESLASDDMKAALEAHKVICDKELSHYKEKYKDCDKKFRDIDDLRNSFKQLSEVYIKNGNKKELKGLIKANCPMAKANWIQKEGSLKNPYYGKSMLDCGEKI